MDEEGKKNGKQMLKEGECTGMPVLLANSYPVAVGGERRHMQNPPTTSHQCSQASNLIIPR